MNDFWKVWCATCNQPFDGGTIELGTFYEVKTGLTRDTAHVYLTDKEIERMHDGHDYEIRKRVKTEIRKRGKTTVVLPSSITPE